MDLSQLFAMLSPEEKERFYQGPAMKPPPGAIVNLGNSPNRNSLGFGLLFTAAALSTLAVAVRVYSRLFTRRRIIMRLEDYLVISAWGIMFAWVYYGWRFIVTGGMYVHQWNVRYVKFVDFMYCSHLTAILYGVIIGLVKVAALLDWLQLFAPLRMEKSMAWTIYIVIALNATYYAAGTIISIFRCHPKKRFWDATTPGTCLEPYGMTLGAGALNMISDFVMFAIPQKVIWSLQMSRAKRAGVSSLFAIGIFACVCGVARLVYSTKLYIHREDLTYALSPVALWSVGELAAGFLIVGTPSLPRIFKETPWMQSVSSWLVTLIRGSSQGTRENSRKGLPSWYKAPPQTKGRHDPYSGLDGDEFVEVPPSRNVIMQKTTVEVNSSKV